MIVPLPLMSVFVIDAHNFVVCLLKIYDEALVLNKYVSGAIV